MMFTDKVYVLIIDHKHGMDVSAFVREDHARQALEVYCRYWWDYEFIDVPVPEDNDELVTRYFEHVTDESWLIKDCDIVVPPEGKDRIGG